MKQKFLERENKLIHDTENERGVKDLFYGQNINLESKQYQNIKNNKTVVQNEIKIEIPKISEDKKIDRKEYSKKNVKLPIINEKSKEESNWRKIDIKSLKGKERINYINKKYFQKNNLLLNSLKCLNFEKKIFLGKKKKLYNNIEEKIY